MELTCPNCGVEIGKHDVWLPLGLARCAGCEEYHRIAAIVDKHAGPPRSEKPPYSKVLIDIHPEGAVVHIPASGWQIDLWGVAVFMGLFFGVGMFALVKGQYPMVNYLLLFIPAMIMIAFALPAYAHTRVVLGQTIMVTWTVRELSRTSSRMACDLVKIADSVAYEVNDEPVYGIGLFFKDGKKITFGARLTEEERRWLIGELSAMVLPSTAD